MFNDLVLKCNGAPNLEKRADFRGAMPIDEKLLLRDLEATEQARRATLRGRPRECLARLDLAWRACLTA